MDAAAHMHSASARIDQMNERTAAHEAEVKKVRENRNFSDEYRRTKVQELQAAHHAYVRETSGAVGTDLDTAAEKASRRLSTTDDAQVSRRLLAAGRVSRVLDAKGPGAALAAFPSDPDALRQLRTELPSWVAVNGGDEEALLLAVDRALAPLATGAEADDLAVRLRLDDERARLKAATQYAVNPNTHNRMLMAFTAEPMPVMRNGRLDRSGAA